MNLNSVILIFKNAFENVVCQSSGHFVQGELTESRMFGNTYMSHNMDGSQYVSCFQMQSSQKRLFIYHDMLKFPQIHFHTTM